MRKSVEKLRDFLSEKGLPHQNERLIAGILPPHRGSIRLKRYAVREFVARERWNGVFVGAYSPDQRNQVNDELLKLYSLGKIEPAIDRVVEFSDVPQAIADLEQRQVTGKLVIEIFGAD